MNKKHKKTIIFLLTLSFIITLSFAGCSQPEQNVVPTQTEPARYGTHGVIYKSVVVKDAPYTLAESEQKRKELAEKMDKADMMYSGRTVVENDPKLIEIPENVAGLKDAGGGFSVAETPPEIEFAIIPYKYRFYEKPPVSTIWSVWAQAAYYADTGKFYAAAGDHNTYNAHLHLVEYDTGQKKVACLPEINKIIGRTKDQFGDGKIHGYLDFYKAGYLPRSHLWFCTYWCKYPEPLEEDWATGYGGGYIMSYDMTTGDIVNYGVPMPRASWPCHRADTVRGILYGVGMYGEFLAWDINEQKTKWAGYLPEGLAWYNRCLLIDEETGIVYSNNSYWNQPYKEPIKHSKPSDARHHLIKYDPYKNRFFELECTMPPNSKTGTYDRMRSFTRQRGPDGLFWGVTYSGEIFSFDPDGEVVKGHGLIWPGNDLYSCTIDRSPGGRYLYYTIAVHGRAYLYGSPVIQYDIKTGKRKVLAFLFNHFYEKYGYIPGGSYAFKLDDRGEKLFMCWNGDFTDVEALKAREGWDPSDVSHYGIASERDAFGHCSVFVLNIPESERIE